MDFHLAFCAIERQTHTHAVLCFQIKRLMPCGALAAVLHTIAQSIAQTIAAGHKRWNCRCIRSAACLVVRVQLESLWSVLYAMCCVVGLRYRVGNVRYIDCIGIYCCCSFTTACRLDVAETITTLCRWDSCFSKASINILRSAVSRLDGMKNSSAELRILTSSASQAVLPSFSSCFTILSCCDF